MKKLLSLFFLIIIIYNYGCGLGPNEKLYRIQITVESNLSTFEISGTSFDSTTVYPYILYDFTSNDPSLASIIYNISPVQDSGFIKFKILGSEGNYPISAFPLILKDTLTIITPIDTTYLSVTDYSIKEF